MVGTKGEIFECNGMVAVAVPPAGNPGAIAWKITYLYPAGRNFPAWADGQVGNVNVRINPDLCQPPYTRLADCLAFVHFNHRELPWDGSDIVALMTFPPEPHPHAQKFIFFRTKIAGHKVVMIDTKERADSFSPQELKSVMGMQRLPRNPKLGNN